MAYETWNSVWAAGSGGERKPLVGGWLVVSSKMKGDGSDREVAKILGELKVFYGGGRTKVKK